MYGALSVIELVMNVMRENKISGGVGGGGGGRGVERKKSYLAGDELP